MKYANSLGADYVLIVSDEEVKRGIVLVRNMKDGTQREIPLDAASLPALVV
jgi:histidyl-tRNA synthetase